VALPSLYFTQSTADLLPTSRPSLHALAQELRQRPALWLEIVGHTDTMGEAAQNLRL
jgi:peptidoglycan-binding protein ArfA